MADERYEWLDRDAAERLLRGEPVGPVGEDARAQAERPALPRRERRGRTAAAGRARHRTGLAGAAPADPERRRDRPRTGRERDPAQGHRRRQGGERRPRRQRAAPPPGRPPVVAPA
ncbi:hypothetical protein [Streptomyces albidochromogenes]|uniref:hypothetical protein n=1 Tax=Streptomyces albidochromogenes TaxID=329524 RepID=UPI00142EB1AB|nr:hypothetical protein [Streptomyces albidochromogenes]